MIMLCALLGAVSLHASEDGSVTKSKPESWKQILWKSVTGITTGAAVVQNTFPAVLGVVTSKIPAFLPAIVAKYGVVASVAASAYTLPVAAACLFSGKVLSDMRSNWVTAKDAKLKSLLSYSCENMRAIVKPVTYVICGAGVIAALKNAK